MVKEGLSQEQEREAEVGKNNHRNPQEAPLWPLEEMVLCGCLSIQKNKWTVSFTSSVCPVNCGLTGESQRSVR